MFRTLVDAIRPGASAEQAAKLAATQDQLADLQRRLSEAEARIQDSEMAGRRLRDELAVYRDLEAGNRLLRLHYPVEMRYRDFSTSPHMKRLRERFAQERPKYARTVSDLAAYLPQLTAIPMEGDGLHWRNDWLSSLDGASLYGLVALRNPSIYMEVGSGNSTMFVRQAIRNHGLRTKIVSIDPYPRADIDKICDEVIRHPLEDASVEVFDRLSGDDMLFVDNSHLALPNSDVSVFFLEVLGRLPKGLIYGVHDIFLPEDYPSEWAPRGYNEQHLLAAYLFGGADGDEIVLPVCHAARDAELMQPLAELWAMGLHPFGGAFWLRKA